MIVLALTILLALAALSVGARPASAHKPSYHHPGTLPTPLAHWRDWLVADTNRIRGEKCLPDLKPRTARGVNVPRGLRRWSVRLWLDNRRDARRAPDYCNNVFYAIRLVFGPYASQAISVARCETGGTFWVGASNGQYLGLFQMGSSERARYGHGPRAIDQARAAYRYFVASGRDWSPWQCRPGGGLAW